MSKKIESDLENADGHSTALSLGKDEIEALRVPGEQVLFKAIILLFIFLLTAPICGASTWGMDTKDLIDIYLGVAAFVLFAWGVSWVSWRFAYWYVHGHSICVGPAQYGHIYEVVSNACRALGISTVPKVFLMQGHGVLELVIAKHYSRRGMIIITSSMVDSLLESGDTRRIMMIVGRQLGHIVAGHFQWWFFQEFFGPFTVFLYNAYRRRCHYTADRIGFLVCGNMEEASKALLVLTVGRAMAEETNFQSVVEQAGEAEESLMSRIQECFDVYPYMILRLVALESFGRACNDGRLLDIRGRALKPLKIQHYVLDFGTNVDTERAWSRVREVREALVEYFSEESQIKMILQDAKIRVERIPMDGGAEVVWKNSIQEAVRANRLASLMRVAYERYPQSDVLRILMEDIENQESRTLRLSRHPVPVPGNGEAGSAPRSLDLPWNVVNACDNHKGSLRERGMTPVQLQSEEHALPVFWVAPCAAIVVAGTTSPQASRMWQRLPLVAPPPGVQAAPASRLEAVARPAKSRK